MSIFIFLHPAVSTENITMCLCNLPNINMLKTPTVDYVRNNSCNIYVIDRCQHLSWNTDYAYLSAITIPMMWLTSSGVEVETICVANPVWRRGLKANLFDQPGVSSSSYKRPWSTGVSNSRYETYRIYMGRVLKKWLHTLLFSRTLNSQVKLVGNNLFLSRRHAINHG